MTPRRTSGVVDARVGDPDALHLRIAGERRRAGAELGVIGGLALGVDAASVSLVAGVPAASAEAHLVGGALVVGRAGGCKISGKGMSLLVQGMLTEREGSVQLTSTLR